MIHCTLAILIALASFSAAQIDANATSANATSTDATTASATTTASSTIAATIVENSTVTGLATPATAINGTSTTSANTTATAAAYRVERVSWNASMPHKLEQSKIFQAGRPEITQWEAQFNVTGEAGTPFDITLTSHNGRLYNNGDSCFSVTQDSDDDDDDAGAGVLYYIQIKPRATFQSGIVYGFPFKLRYLEATWLNAAEPAKVNASILLAYEQRNISSDVVPLTTTDKYAPNDNDVNMAYPLQMVRIDCNPDYSDRFGVARFDAEYHFDYVAPDVPPPSSSAASSLTASLIAIASVIVVVVD